MIDIKLHNHMLKSFPHIYITRNSGRHATLFLAPADGSQPWAT